MDVASTYLMQDPMILGGKNPGYSDATMSHNDLGDSRCRRPLVAASAIAFASNRLRESRGLSLILERGLSATSESTKHVIRLQKCRYDSLNLAANALAPHLVDLKAQAAHVCGVLNHEAS